MKVIFIDDEPAFLEQAKIFLERADSRLDVDTFPSAERALDSLDDENYDAIVSDYLLNDMDGVELLKKLRDEGNDIVFIIYTGKGSKEVEEKVMELGADRYLRKGGNPRDQYENLAEIILEQVENKESSES